MSLRDLLRTANINKQQAIRNYNILEFTDQLLTSVKTKNLDDPSQPRPGYHHLAIPSKTGRIDNELVDIGFDGVEIARSMGFQIMPTPKDDTKVMNMGGKLPSIYFEESRTEVPQVSLDYLARALYPKLGAYKYFKWSYYLVVPQPVSEELLAQLTSQKKTAQDTYTKLVYAVEYLTILITKQVLDPTNIDRDEFEDPTDEFLASLPRDSGFFLIPGSGGQFRNGSRIEIEPDPVEVAFNMNLNYIQEPIRLEVDIIIGKNNIPTINPNQFNGLPVYIPETPLKILAQKAYAALREEYGPDRSYTVIYPFHLVIPPK